MYITHTAYTSSLLNCYLDMIEKYSKGKAEESMITDRELDSNNEMVIPVFPGKTMYSLIENYRKTSSKSYASLKSNGDGYTVNINSFTQSVFQSSVIELGTMTFEDGVKFCNTVVKDDINSFYGVLMFGSNGIINPFHPLVACSMKSKIEKNSKVLKEKFRVVLYGSSLDKRINNLYEYGMNGNIDNIKNNIAHQIILYEENNKFCTYDKLLSAPEDLAYQASMGVFKNLDIERTTSFYDVELEDKNIEFTAIVPVQIGVRGIAFPWYGSVLAWRGKVNGYTGTDTHGVQLSPFLSANVGYSDGELTSDRLIFNNICTGNFDRSKIEGIRTINRANFDSPLCKFGVETGWIQWKDECVKTSFEIYSEVIDLNVKERKLSYKEQWLKDNPSMDEAAYLTHLAQKLTHKEPITALETREGTSSISESAFITEYLINEDTVFPSIDPVFNRTVARNERMLSSVEGIVNSEEFRNMFNGMVTVVDTARDDSVDVSRYSSYIPEPVSEPVRVRRTRRRRNPETGELE